MTDATRSSDSSNSQESELQSQLAAPDEDWLVAWLAECDARVAAAGSDIERATPWTEVYERLRDRFERGPGMRSR